jgi:myo-inositol 2-dehydrogenase/D-chiro-inositol 1-dehydrogenase
MTIRIGIIGTGNIGTSHAANLARVVSGSSVSVVFDADAARAREVAGDFGARVAPTVIDVIEADDVDAVLIASPDAMHAEQALIAIAAGKPMLCEKPLAVGDVNARNVVDAEVAFGRRLIQVGFMRRFDPGYNRLKAELTASGIGEPLIVHNVHRNTSAPYGLRTEQTLTNMVTHEFDINRWLIGEELTSVMVLPGKRGPLTPEGESDPILVVLQSQTGVLIEVEAFCNAQYGYEVQCRVTGSRGQAVMGDGAWVTRSADFVRGTELPELWLGRFAEAYRMQLQSWIDSLKSGGPLLGASAWDGYAAAVISDRAIEAHRTGRRVDIELPAKPPLYC